MDLENIWKSSGESDKILHQALHKDISTMQSKLPLKKLKNSLLSGMVWAVLITAGYMALYFFVNIWQVYIALTTLIVFNIWIMIESWKLYKSIPETITPGLSVKQELEKNYAGFKDWWRIQQRVSLFVYPIAVAGGFILGGTLGSGKSVEAFLYKPQMLMILAITIAVVVPVCYFGAKWMFGIAYGKHLNNIKMLISELGNTV